MMEAPVHKLDSGLINKPKNTLKMLICHFSIMIETNLANKSNQSLCFKIKTKNLKMKPLLREHIYIRVSLEPQNREQRDL